MNITLPITPLTAPRHPMNQYTGAEHAPAVKDFVHGSIFLDPATGRTYHALIVRGLAPFAFTVIDADGVANRPLDPGYLPPRGSIEIWRPNTDPEELAHDLGLDLRPTNEEIS